MKNINLIVKELFYVLVGALVIFIILEILWPNVVLSYLNINWVLLGWLFIGIIILTTDKKIISARGSSASGGKK